MRVRAHAAWLTAIAVLVPSQMAHADGSFDGTWSGGATRLNVTIQSWGNDCGPRPQSTTVPATGNIAVAQEGDHLVFRGRRTRRTNGCWSPNRSVVVRATSFQSGQWRTVCSTPETDPKQERGTYTLRWTDPDHLEFTDHSEYNWQLNTSRCIATLDAAQTFTRVRAPAEAAPTLNVTKTAARCTPGTAAKLSLRPARARIEPGERVCFRTKLTDAHDCELNNNVVTLSLRQAEGKRVSVGGLCFEAGATAAESEGVFQVVAASAGLESQSTVTVRAMDLTDLMAERLGSEESEEGEAEMPAPEARPAVHVSAPHPAAAAAVASWAWWIFGLVALGGIGLVIVLAVRRKPTPQLTRAPSERSAPIAPSSVPPEPTGPPRICPKCRRGYPPGSQRCTTDNEQLVDYGTFAAQKESPAAAASRVCPTCGAAYGANVVFCGKDGARLPPPGQA